MAKVIVFDQQHKQVGYVDFMFTGNHTESYIFLNIDANYAFTFHLQTSTIFDANGRAVAKLQCGSNGKDVGGSVSLIRQSYTFPVIGTINGSNAAGIVAHTWTDLGKVISNTVKNNHYLDIGELSIRWDDSTDEQFFQQSLREFGKTRDMSNDRIRELLEQLRPGLYQNLLNFAGCASLIVGLFDNKKK